ncbi:MAG: cohesin domain-containing protein [Candidatus Cloacimonetes bacterium]|nr:cohesin domain-containing protein [Candidatus Cloacimonadota bacterium]
MRKVSVILFMGVILIFTACSKPTDSNNPNDENHVPTMELPENISFLTNNTLTKDFSAYISDADNDTLALTVTGNSIIVITITGLMVEMSAPADWTGSETVTFIVDDGYVRVTASDVVVINVVDSSNPVITLESITVNNGADFNIALSTTLIESSSNFIAFQCTLSYDINYLEYNGISSDNTITAVNCIANETEPGVVIIAYANYIPITGEGALAYINFTALSVGETIIDLENFKYNSDNMNNLIDSVVIIE